MNLSISGQAKLFGDIPAHKPLVSSRASFDSARLGEYFELGMVPEATIKSKMAQNWPVVASIVLNRLHKVQS